MNPDGIVIRNYSLLSSEIHTYQWRRVKQIMISEHSSRQYPYGIMDIYLNHPKEDVPVNLEQIFDIRAKIPFIEYNKINKKILSNICKKHSVHFYWFD